MEKMVIRGLFFVPSNDGYGKQDCPKYEKKCGRNCKTCTQGDALIQVEKNKELISKLLKDNEELIRRHVLKPWL